MDTFNPQNAEHVEIATSAAVEAYMNVAGISRAVKEALEDENIRPTEEAYSVALAAVRKFKAD